jgi:hypothetical protein
LIFFSRVVMTILRNGLFAWLGAIGCAPRGSEGPLSLLFYGGPIGCWQGIMPVLGAIPLGEEFLSSYREKISNP